MVSRRTWARLGFLGSLFGLALQVYQWYHATDETDETVSVAPWWLVAGIGYQILYSWAYDCDSGAIRTNRWRRGLLAAFWTILGLRVFPRSERVLANFSVGGSIGYVCYRLWYGVIHPLPGTDD